MSKVFERTTIAPAHQTRLDVNPTLIVSWFCTIFSLVVILIRTAGRWIRTERLFREDKVMLLAIIPLLARMAFIHPVLIWGTNNVHTFALSEQDIVKRSIGSRLVLGARIFYAVYIWVAKVTVLEFAQRTIAASWSKFYERGARIIYSFLGLTLIGVIVSTLAECQPFDHYWQVVPDPGPGCRAAPAQLITMATCDMITDIVLMLWPIPLVIKSKMRPVKKATMMALFLLQFILIAITAYRLPSTMARGYRQQYRSLLASLEILAATCITNVIAIGSFLRDKGVKKIKFRADSIVADDDGEGSILTRPATRTTKPSIAQRHWGSDEDLVRDFGLSLSRDLRHDSIAISETRVAPSAEPVLETYQELPEPEPTINPQGRGLVDPAWTFRKGSHKIARSRKDSDASSDSDMSNDFKMQNLEPYTDEPTSPTGLPETPYKKMNFFDVGGLIDLDASEQSSIDHASRRLSNAMSNHNVSRSGQNFITDVGGFLGSPTRHDTESSPSQSTRNSVYRTSNLLTPDQTIRERSRPTLNRDTSVVVPSGRHANSVVAAPTPYDAMGPDDLNISDAGGLLK